MFSSNTINKTFLIFLNSITIFEFALIFVAIVNFMNIQVTYMHQIYLIYNDYFTVEMSINPCYVRYLFSLDL